MLRLGLEPLAGPSLVMPYSVRGQRFANVIGVVHGSDAERESGGSLPIVLGAHYDTVSGTPRRDTPKPSRHCVPDTERRAPKRDPPHPPDRRDELTSRDLRCLTPNDGALSSEDESHVVV